MKRRRLTPFLVLAVVVALGVFVWRRASGPPVPSGIVQLRSIDGVEGGAFELPQGGRVVVEASGSAGADGQLEAFGWILDGATRRVVWRMTPATSRAAEGTRRLASDTLTLPAGSYEAYFSGVGSVARRGGALSRIANRRETWRNDRPLWYLAVRPLAGVLATPLRLASAGERVEPRPPVVWTSAPQRSERAVQLLEVARTAPLALRFTGSEIGSGGRATLVRLPERTLVWEATAAASRPAGGSARNRVAEATVMLDPGLYEVEAQVARDHRPGDWQQTPPDDPRAWGLTVSSGEAGAVSVFDAWRRAPAIRYEARTPDTERIVDFTVGEPLSVFIDATGEITGEGERSRADYGWIVNEATAERVWDMRYGETTPAGGSPKNRHAERVVVLAPGRYALHFVTDDSHHGGDFNSDPPRNPERYGVALFPLGSARALTVTSQRSVSTGDGDSGDVVSPIEDEPMSGDASVPPPPSSAGSLAAITRVRGSQNERESFRMETGGFVRVYATGERIGDSWYDWAEIREPNGDVVWSMKTARMQSAGGDRDRNVLFDGSVELDAGRYVLVYQSDGSHHYGEFGSSAPTHNFWGAIVLRDDIPSIPGSGGPSTTGPPTPPPPSPAPLDGGDRNR